MLRPYCKIGRAIVPVKMKFENYQEYIIIFHGLTGHN